MYIIQHKNIDILKAYNKGAGNINPSIFILQLMDQNFTSPWSTGTPLWKALFLTTW